MLQVGMWATPILWNISMLDKSPVLQKILKINPVFYIVNGYRDTMFAKKWFWQDFYSTAYFWIVTRGSTTTAGKLVDGSMAEVKPEDVPQAAPGVTAERKATGAAKSFDKKLAGTYAVTAGSGLHIRNVAGSKTGSMVVLPCGTKVQNYGYYTEVNGVKWLYIQVTYQGVKYTGFSSGAYLKKYRRKTSCRNF